MTIEENMNANQDRDIWDIWVDKYLRSQSAHMEEADEQKIYSAVENDSFFKIDYSYVIAALISKKKKVISSKKSDYYVTMNRRVF